MEKNYDGFGLTEQEVLERRRNGLANTAKKKTTKSYRHILFENIFSIFNFMNLAIAAVLVYVGSVKNCLFMLVVVCNTFIGIIQEIRSKRVIDKLSIVNQATVNVVREGKKKLLDISELVKDDIIELSSGCQIPNDCVVEDGCCEVNESLITGESDSLFKQTGEKLLSGSYVVSGRCLCRVTGVGKENYADSILGQIKYVKKSNSEIVGVIKRIILIISICIVPFGGLLFYNQFTLAHNTLEEAVVSSAAAIIGMIPEGLVLLISTVFAIGVIRLSKKKVLSQDLYSLETLARTDVLCLDKTGTITTGEMKLEGAVPSNNITVTELEELASIIANYSQDDNSTVKAIRKAYTEAPKCEVIKTVPFSSDRKWSAVCTKEYGTVIMGAAEMIFNGKADFSVLDSHEKDKYRIVTLARSNDTVSDRELPKNVDLVGFILLSEEVRESISETLRYFEEEDVEIKVISGDNPSTVQKLCGFVFDGSECDCIDMSKVKDDEVEKIVEKNRIFGRVTPNQKKLIVKALKAKGHTVSMVGDGVNDVLALKESDCSVAPANGSEAARSISKLVLLDSDFRSLPAVVGEGRRSINNLQNSASLFLSKTIFSAVMALIFMFIQFPYPFEPIQMTLISALTIGVPAFVLSFLKNNNRIRGKFIRNVIRNCIPAALTNVLSVVAVVIYSEIMGFDEYRISSLCVLLMAVTGILLIIKIYAPLTPIKISVIVLSIGGFLLAFSLFHKFFGLAPVINATAFYMILAAVIDAALFLVLITFFNRKRKS